jgi:hypothetical protein
LQKVILTTLVDLENFIFPKKCKFKSVGNIWVDGIAISLLSKGSFMTGNTIVLSYWVVVDTKGEVHTIFNLKDVKFI